MRTAATTLLAALILAGSLTTARGELPPDEWRECFPGAYYRKAVSSVDYWQGIEGIIRLPQPHLDMEDLHPVRGRPNSNSSIYMGGNADEQESDAGLTWEIIRRPNGTISTMPKAFRPFWRVTDWNNAPALPQYYYLPGDVLRMKVISDAPQTMTMEIEVIERTPESLEFLSQWGEVDAYTTFTVTFDAPGYGPDVMQEYKRVNAIDLYGREGLDVVETKSRIGEAEWLEVWLWRNGERLPMTRDRFTDMQCPDPKHHVVVQTENADRGGEKITIFGTPPAGNGWTLP